MEKALHGYTRQRKNGLWEGQYIFQKQLKSIYGHTKADVKYQLDEIHLSIEEGSYCKPNEHTVESWLKEWMESYAKIYLRPSTFINYEAIINRHILPHFGKSLLRNVSTRSLQAFFNDKLATGRCDGKKGGLSSKTLKNIKHMLNVAFSQAYYERIIPFNPIDGIKLPVPDYIEQKVLNSQEKNSLFAEAHKQNNIFAKGIILLLQCGLRKGELLALTWENVNFDANCIYICSTLSRLPHFETTPTSKDYVRVDTHVKHATKTGLYMGPVKTPKANRTIFLPISAKEALCTLKDIQVEYCDASIVSSFNPFGFVLCSEMGYPIDPKTFDDKFKTIVNLAEVKDINVHATRHTFATEALLISQDLVTISEILGHAKPSTTLDMYGHTFDSRKKALMSKFE